jgi:hypothetical protein
MNALMTGIKIFTRKVLAKKIEYTNKWQFNGKDFDTDDIGIAQGFVYVIETPDGKFYIGRKYFHSIRKVKDKVRRQRTESDWKNYYGSSVYLKEIVKEQGKDSFKRIILSLHKTRGDCNYEETKQQFIHDVLEDSNFLNDNINGKWHRKPQHIIDDRVINEEYNLTKRKE